MVAFCVIHKPCNGNTWRSHNSYTTKSPYDDVSKDKLMTVHTYSKSKKLLFSAAVESQTQTQTNPYSPRHQLLANRRRGQHL